jgi:translation initiation factor 2 alpha subunit (eIF-2alpha)
MNEQIIESWENINRVRCLLSIVAEDLSGREYEASESLILLEKQLGAIADKLDREAFQNAQLNKT